MSDVTGVTRSVALRAPIAATALSMLALLGLASAIAAQETTTTSSTVDSATTAVTVPTTTTTKQTRLGWQIVDDGAACPGSVPADAIGETVMTREQAICLSAPALSTLDERLDVSDGGLKLTVKEPFVFRPSELASQATFTLDRGGDPIAIHIEPDIELSVKWFDDEKALDVDEGAIVTEEALTDVTKVVSVSGSDLITSMADPANDGLELTVEEKIDQNRLEAMDIADRPKFADGIATWDIKPNEEISYRLKVRDDRNFGSLPLPASTELRLGDTRLGLIEQTLTMDAPKIEIELRFNTAVEQETTQLKVVVENTGRIDPAPYTVKLSAVQDPGLIKNIGELGEDGQADGSKVTWEVPALRSDDNDTIERSAQVQLSRPSEKSDLVWKAEIFRQGTDEPIAQDEKTMTVTGAPSDSTVQVEFSSAQLVRLIAFVMAFALIAIIFGAWTRTRRSPPTGVGPEADAERSHELNVFKAFAESIIVLVILVSILVLALRGSLEAQSAGSLIGVIAGYALGQGRK